MLSNRWKGRWERTTALSQLTSSVSQECQELIASSARPGPSNSALTLTGRDRALELRPLQHISHL